MEGSVDVDPELHGRAVFEKEGNLTPRIEGSDRGVESSLCLGCMYEDNHAASMKRSPSEKRRQRTVTIRWGTRSTEKEGAREESVPGQALRKSSLSKELKLVWKASTVTHPFSIVHSTRLVDHTCYSPVHGINTARLCLHQTMPGIPGLEDPTISVTDGKLCSYRSLVRTRTNNCVSSGMWASALSPGAFLLLKVKSQFQETVQWSVATPKQRYYVKQQQKKVHSDDSSQNSVPLCLKLQQLQTFWPYIVIVWLLATSSGRIGIHGSISGEQPLWRQEKHFNTPQNQQKESAKSWEACKFCSKESSWPEFAGLKAPVCTNETGRMKLSPFTGAEKSKLNNRMCDPCKNCKNCAACDIQAVLVSAGGSSQHLFLRTIDFAGVEHLALVGNKQVRKRWRQPIENAEPVHLLASACGLGDIVATEKVGSLRSVVVQDGRHVQITGENVVFSEIVETSPRFKKKCTAISGHEVIKAALFDFLLGMCDRTVSNIFVNKKGQLKLIDNIDSAFNVYGYSWRALGCFAGVRSIFIRTFAYAQRYEWPFPPPSCYDYRCHAPGGKIGKDYPETFKSCIDLLSKYNTSMIYSNYRLPSMQSAERLRERAKWLNSGFEQAIFQNYRKYGNIKSKHVMFNPKVFQPEC
eukprot:scaffold456_cov368-Pavlova_lutheri.AAC.8